MNRSIQPACICALVCLACSSSGCSEDSPAGESLPLDLGMLGALDRLAEDRADAVEPVMFSTYDRTGGNLDFHLATHLVLDEDEEGRTVLFDADGPGVVTRLWMTHFSVEVSAGGEGTLVHIPGDILFFFDHEDTPRIDMTLQEFFRGDNAPMLSPFVFDADASSGGYISYIPFPYREHLRIVSTEPVPYLQVNALRVLEGDVESFSPDEIDADQLAHQVQAWTDLETPLASPDATLEQQTLTAALEAPLRLLVEGGPATAARLTLTPTEPLPAPPPLRLQINVDGQAPEVDVPFGDFFLTPLAQVEAKGRVLGYDGTRYYVTFPMPYEDSVEVAVLVGEGGDAVTFDVELETVPGHPAGSLRFHASFSESELTPADGDHPVLDVQGRGHLVGSSMVLCCIEDCSYLSPRFAHLEGDERITIDGAEEPQLHGTGAEDYFNSGFYYANGSYHQPTHGMPFSLAEEESGLDDPYGNGAFDCTTQYRLQLTDVVPFRASLRFDIEHGPTSNLHTYFRSVAYWYQQD